MIDKMLGYDRADLHRRLAEHEKGMEALEAESKRINEAFGIKTIPEAQANEIRQRLSNVVHDICEYEMMGDSISKAEALTELRDLKRMLLSELLEEIKK